LSFQRIADRRDTTTPTGPISACTSPSTTTTTT
jgi:hypothetical protein